jgi:hypothetical protein
MNTWGAIGFGYKSPLLFIKGSVRVLSSLIGQRLSALAPV